MEDKIFQFSKSTWCKNKYDYSWYQRASSCARSYIEMAKVYTECTNGKVYIECTKINPVSALINALTFRCHKQSTVQFKCQVQDRVFQFCAKECTFKGMSLCPLRLRGLRTTENLHHFPPLSNLQWRKFSKWITQHSGHLSNGGRTTRSIKHFWQKWNEHQSKHDTQVAINEGHSRSYICFYSNHSDCDLLKEKQEAHHFIN